MKRIILAILFLIVIGTANVNQINNQIEIEPEVALPVTKLSMRKHADETYTFTSLDGKISFTYHWCMEAGLQKLFSHPLFEKVDKRFLEKFTHIVHTDNLNPFFKVNYIIYGMTNFIYIDNVINSIYIQINTRVEHFLEIGMEAVIWHEMVHLLLGGVEHCNNDSCPILSKAGSDSSLEELIKEFNDTTQTEVLEYIIEKQKDW